MQNKKNDDQCQHPKHEVYLAAFLKKYPTANKDARFATNMADPEEWNVYDDQSKNTLGCCIICTITEDIMRSKIRNIATPGYGTMDKQI